MKPARPRVLVLGGTGRAGHAVVCQLCALGVDTTFTFCLHPMRASVLPGHREELDLLNNGASRELRRIVREVRPHLIVNAGPALGPAPARMVARCARRTSLLHLSSNAVFRPAQKLRRPGARPNALTNYGCRKALEEAAVRAEGGVVLRTSFVGPCCTRGPDDQRLDLALVKRQQAIAPRLWNGVGTGTLAHYIALFALLPHQRRCSCAGAVLHLRGDVRYWHGVVHAFAAVVGAPTTEYAGIRPAAEPARGCGTTLLGGGIHVPGPLRFALVRTEGQLISSLFPTVQSLTQVF